jgi:predicted MFS family arabinose efflux permease
MSVSVENLDDQNNVEPEEVTPQMRRRRMLRMICDPELMCNPLFLLFIAAIGIGHSGYMSTCFFIPLYTNELWASESLNAALISLMGVSDLIGRVLGGYIADLNLLPKPYLVAISFLFCSIMVLLMPFIARIGVIFTCAILFGLVGGSYLSMLVVIIVELFGEHKLPIGLGLTTLSMGLTMLPIPPTFGRHGFSHEHDYNYYQSTWPPTPARRRIGAGVI